MESKRTNGAHGGTRCLMVRIHETNGHDVRIAIVTVVIAHR